MNTRWIVTTLLSATIAVFIVYLLAIRDTSLGLELIQVHEMSGEALTDSVSLGLEQFGYQYLLLQASQQSADYKLEVLGDSGRVSATDFSSRFGLSEVLLVDTGACTNCFVSMQAQESLDTKSPFSLKIFGIDPLEKGSSEELAFQEIYTKFNEAAKLSYESRVAESREQSQLADKRSMELLEFVVNIDAIDWNDIAQLKMLAALHLALKYDQNGMRSEAENLYKILQSAWQPDLLRIHALYESIAFDTDVNEIETKLSLGIALSIGSDNPIAEAQGYNYLAIQKARQAKYLEALELYKKATDIYFDNKNFRNVLSPLYNVAWTHIQAGQFASALSSAAEHRVLSEQFGDIENSAWSAYISGLAYLELDRTDAADDAFSEARTSILQATKSKQSNSMRALEAYLDLATAKRHHKFNSSVLALGYTSSAKKGFASLGYRNRVAETEELEAKIFLNQRDFDKAESRLLSVIENYEKNDRIRQRNRARHALGELYFQLNQTVDAELAFNSAASDHQEIDDEPFKLSLLQSRAKLALETDQIQHAVTFLNEASLKSIEEFGFGYVVEDFYLRGRLKEKLGEHQDALYLYQQARQSLSRALASVWRRSERQALSSHQRKLYEASIRSLLKFSVPDDSRLIGLFESYKARTFSEALISADFNNDRESETLNKKSDKLLSQLAYLAETEKDELPLFDIKQLTRELEQLESEFQRRKLERITEKETIDGISSEISYAPATFSISYFFGKESSWLWWGDGSKSGVEVLANHADLSEQIDSYVSQIAMPPTSRDLGLVELRNLSWQIGDAFLGPIASRLRSGEYRDIVIAVDGPLSRVPFSTLRLEIDDVPIAAQANIITVSSLSNYSIRSKAHSAPPALVSKPAHLVLGSLESSSGSYARLRYAEEEAVHVREIIGEAQLVEYLPSRSTKERLRNALKSPFGVLHIAAHGVVDYESPELSRLILSPSDVSNQSWLLSEIVRERLDGDLVVLAACESVAGEFVDGEGVISLSRAFLEAGVRSVVGSLWRVDDQATAIFMKHFYQRHIRDNMDAHEALRFAKMDMALGNNVWVDPYYWGAFQYHGG